MIDIGQERRLKDESKVSGLDNNNQLILRLIHINTVLSALIILSHLNLTTFLRKWYECYPYFTNGEAVTERLM